MNLTFIRQVGPVRWAVRYGVFQLWKRVLHRDLSYRLPSGAPIVLPRQSQYSGSVYVTKAKVDWGSERLFAAFSDPGRDFLDIGAHFGYYSNFLAPLVRRVFAFEPDPRNIPHLRRNGALVGNVEVVESALSSRVGSAVLHQSSSSSISSLEGNGPGIVVPTTTVDSFASGRPGLDIGLVKTDVEGHDLEVLRGMQETVRRCRPVILTECRYSTDVTRLCEEWSYGALAITREQDQIHGTTLEHLPTDASRTFVMMFLVPAERVTTLEQAWCSMRAG